MNGNCVVHFAVLTILLSVFPHFAIGQECDASGVKCISCTDYQNCTAGVPEGEIYSCKNGDACTDPTLEKCRLKLNCIAGNDCTGAGIFPDVMVESNFYVCLGDPFMGFMKYDFICQEGHYFDQSTSACVPGAATSTESTPATETSPVSTTVSSSTSASETTPTTITTGATSTETTPTTVTTVAPSTETTLTTITTVTPSTETTPTTITTAATTLETTLSSTTPSTTTVTTTASPPIACIMSGIFPFPSNCKMYYRCSTSLKAFYYVCPGTSYFNENILKCSMVISPACQEQILMNTTTTSAPLTTTSTSPTPTTTTPAPTTTTLAPTTTTPAPTTTTPAPTTTTPAPTTTTSAPTTTTPVPTTTSTTTPVPTTTSTTTPAAFLCPTSGTFANPVSCKTYFRCSTTGTIFTYTCPGESYYNEFTRRCSLQMTPRCQQLLQV